MNYEYGKINQIRKGWWQAIRKHPLRALLALLVLAFVVVASSFFSGIGDQLARPRSSLTGGKDRQSVRIDFESERPFVDRVVLGDSQWNGYHFQVGIRNESDRSTIRVKYLKLTDLRQLKGGAFKAWENAVPSFLEWPRGTPREIPPRDQVLVPFARIYPPELQKITDRILSGDIDTPQLRFTVFPWDRRMTSHVPPGTHRFKLTAFFEDMPPAEMELELEWPGQRRESVESMAQEIKIGKLEN